MSEQHREFGLNGQATSRTACRPKDEDNLELLNVAPVIPSPLYTVNDDGIYRVSEELEAIRRNERDAVAMPTEQIRQFAGESDAKQQVTQLAKSVANRPRAGLMAAMDREDKYLDFEGTRVGAEAARLEEEYLARPDYVWERYSRAGWKSMSRLKRTGLILGLASFLTMGVWTGTADVALLYGNFSVANPADSGEIDFSAMYGSESEQGDDLVAEAGSEEPSILEDPNLYKSIAGFAGLFVLAQWLNLLRAVPLIQLQPMPRGLMPKVYWLFSHQGLKAVALVVIVAAAVTLNARIGFELDRSATDVDGKSPVSAVLTYSLLAFSLAFSTYAFLHWAKQIFDQLCGVRLVLDKIKLELHERMTATNRVLSSIVSVQSCFAGLRSDQEAFEDSFVVECLSVLAGIQGDQRRAAEFADAAADRAAADARMNALYPSAN